jgi:hypothetical protein
MENQPFKNDGKSPAVKDVAVGCGCLTFLIILLFGACSSMIAPKETTQEKLLKWYSSTSNFSCERILKRSLRDPDSYKRESDFVSSSDTGSTKKVMWRFRSKNGFGGYMPGIARCFVSKDDTGTNTTGSVRAEIANE